MSASIFTAGYATSQDVYDAAVKKVFMALDKVEKQLEKRSGTGLTTLLARFCELDLRLWVILVRTDLFC